MSRYRIDALIARAAMADVFLARDRRLDRNGPITAFRTGAADPSASLPKPGCRLG